jgi:hypothetical protein
MTLFVQFGSEFEGAGAYFGNEAYVGDAARMVT